MSKYELASKAFYANRITREEWAKGGLCHITGTQSRDRPKRAARDVRIEDCRSYLTDRRRGHTWYHH